MEHKLPDDVAKKYDCTIVPGIIVTSAPNRERIDLKKITLAKADKLYSEGKLPMLTLKKVAGTSVSGKGASE